MNGEGVEQDVDEGMGLAIQASDADCVDAHLLLGKIYKNGSAEGIPPDVEQAHGYLMLASLCGDHDGQYELAELSRYGRIGVGVTWLSVDEGDLYRKSARSGNKLALHELGKLHSARFSIVSFDPARAADYFRRAERLGNIDSNVQLGRLLKYGRGIRRNTGKAVRRFRTAADAGNEHGLVEIGLCARDGIGIEKNGQKAAELFQAAADLGNMFGKLFLGFCNLHGVGLEKNRTAAMALFRTAVADINK